MAMGLYIDNRVLWFIIFIISGSRGGSYTELTFFTATGTPLLKDLYKHITPQYAADRNLAGSS